MSSEFGKERRGPGPFGPAARPSALSPAERRFGCSPRPWRSIRPARWPRPSAVTVTSSRSTPITPTACTISVCLPCSAAMPASGVELIGKAITLNDGVGDYHYNIALGWRALNRMDAVAAHLERAVELRPTMRWPISILAMCAASRADWPMPPPATSARARSTPPPRRRVINLANVLAEQGRWDAAVAAYRQALALDPNHAEAQHRLGAALMAQGKAAEAIAPFEATIALRPDLTAGYEGLSAACLTLGKLDVAVHAIARGLELKDTPEARTLFAQCVKLVRFTAPNERLRRLVLRALSEGWARPRELDKVCISLVKLNPIVTECMARAASGVADAPSRRAASRRSGTSGPAGPTNSRLPAAMRPPRRYRPRSPVDQYSSRHADRRRRRRRPSRRRKRPEVLRRRGAAVFHQRIRLRPAA